MEFSGTGQDNGCNWCGGGNGDSRSGGSSTWMSWGSGDV